MGEGVAAWLRGYPGGFDEGVGIALDRLAAAPQACALVKAAGDQARAFVDGSRDVRAHYRLLVRRSALTDAMRARNQRWLEGLQAWIERQSAQGALPMLGEARTCCAVRVQKSYAPHAQEGAEAVYRLDLVIEYWVGGGA